LTLSNSNNDDWGLFTAPFLFNLTSWHWNPEFDKSITGHYRRHASHQHEMNQ